MLELHPQIISRNGQREWAVLPWDEFEKLRALIEDAQDLRDLEASIRENADDAPLPYEQVRRELGLTSEGDTAA